MIYDKFANDIYWNSDRIINNLDDWFIYVKWLIGIIKALFIILMTAMVFMKFLVLIL